MRSTMPYRPGPEGRVVRQRYQSTAEDGSRTTETVLHTLTAADADVADAANSDGSVCGVRPR